MKLSLERLEEIIMAKVRMAEDSLAIHVKSGRRDEQPNIETFSAVVQCLARRDLALALLHDLKRAEQIAIDAALG